MTELYFPFATGAGTEMTEARWVLLMRHALANGVLRGELSELLVQAGSGLQVIVGTGQGVVQARFYQSDAPLTKAIANPDATNPRIDRVVLRLNDSPSATTDTPPTPGDAMEVRVLPGTPAVSPTPAALTQSGDIYEIPLAQVLVNAGVSNIIAGNVTDERLWSGARSVQVTTATVASTTSTSYVPVPGFALTLATDQNGVLRVWTTAEASSNTAGGLVRIILALDGVIQTSYTTALVSPSGGQGGSLTLIGRFDSLAVGNHTVQVHFQTNSGATASLASRTLLVQTERG